MNAIRIIAALACGASALVLAASASASASPQMTGSGTFTVTSVIVNSVRLADGNVILDITQQGIDTGTRSGTAVNNYEVVIHPNGLETLHGFGTFTGTLAGCGPVDGTFLTEGQGYIDASGESVIDGHTRRVDNASSESAATVMTWHTVGAAGTYEIMYHC